MEVFQSPKRDQGRLWVKVKPQLKCRLQDTGVSWDIWQGCGQVCSEAGLYLGDKLCELWMAEPEKWSCISLLEPEGHEYISDVRHRTFYIVGFCFCFDLITTMPCFSLEEWST